MGSNYTGLLAASKARPLCTPLAQRHGPLSVKAHTHAPPPRLHSPPPPPRSAPQLRRRNHRGAFPEGVCERGRGVGAHGHRGAGEGFAYSGVMRAPAALLPLLQRGAIPPVITPPPPLERAPLFPRSGMIRRTCPPATALPPLQSGRLLRDSRLRASFLASLPSRARARQLLYLTEGPVIAAPEQ